MKVRGALIVALLVLAAAPVVAQDKKADLKPEMYLPETKFDFGKVFEQEKYEHDFVVRNNGKADLVIQNVKPG